jgi:TP901 family phage tail tape measure protein
MSATISIKWALDVVDRGQVKGLLRQTSELRQGLEKTDRQYAKTAAAGASAFDRQRRAAQSASDAERRAAVAQGRAALQVERAQKQAASATQRYGRESLQARTAALKLADAENRLATASRRAGDAAASAASRQAAASRRIQTAERQRDRTAAARSRVGSSVRSTAAGLAGGYALYAGGRAVITQTVEFDKALRNVNSIAQLHEKTLQRLGGRLLDLAGKTGQAPTTLAAGMYDLVSSGFAADKSLKILRSSARAATAGLTDTATSTSAVAAVLNAYHRPARDAANVSDVLFQTVNKGVISFEQLAQNIGDVLPFASSLGVNLDQVGAAFSTLTKQGISPAESATRIKSLLQALIKPSEDASAAIEKTGASSGEALVKHRGLQGALEAMIATTDGSKTSVARLFPNIRALGGALALTGKNSRTAHKDIAAFGDAAKGATSRALAEQSKSVAYQWNRLKATASGLAIQVGSKLLPAVNDLAPKVITFVRQMSNGEGAGGRFADSMSKLWSGLRAVGGVIGTVVGGFVKFGATHPAVLKLAGGIVAIGVGLKALRFVSALTGINQLIGLFGRLRTSAQQAAVAEEDANAAATGGGVGPAGRMGRLRGRFSTVRARLPRAGAIGLGGIAAAQTAGSLIGGRTGSAVASIGSGAALGASVGSLAGPVGTAVGAVGGAVISGISHFIGQHKDDVQKQMLDVLSLKGSEVRLHVGQVTVTKDDAKKYTDALENAQKLGSTRKYLGVQRSGTKPSAALDRAFTSAQAKAYGEAGMIAVRSFQDAVKRGPKYTTSSVLLRGFVDQLQDIPDKFRGQAKASMIQYAEGLQQSGRLPMSQLKAFINAMGVQYTSISPLALGAGKAADRAMARGIAADKARAAAQKTMRRLSNTFGEIPHDITLTSKNAGEKLKEGLDQLRHEIQTSHGQRKRDAQQAYQELLAVTRNYTRKQTQAAVSNAKAMSKQVVAALRAIQTAAERAASVKVAPIQAPVSPHSPQNRRRGGRNYADGGLVPIMAAGGEMLVHQGRAMVIPGDPRSDSTPMLVPSGSAVITGHGQGLMAGGASLNETLRYQLPHFQTGGRVLTPGQMAGLAYTHGVHPRNEAYRMGAYGMRESKGKANAHNYDPPRDDSWGLWQINVLPQANPRFKSWKLTDPDVNARAMSILWKAGGEKPWSGYPESSISGYLDDARHGFTTSGLPASKTARTRPAKPRILGRSLTRAGLLDDALSQGIDAGAAGLSRGEITRALHGARGARGNPILQSVREAMTVAPRTRAHTASGAAGATSRRADPRVLAMQAKARELNPKPYVYGGGHTFGPAGGYDCSGLVSNLLHAGGFTDTMMTTDGLKTWGVAGDGKLVTVGVRGTTGRSAHTAIGMRRSTRNPWVYWESSSNGVAKSSTWPRGSFPIHRHPRGYRRGGQVGLPAARAAARAAGHGRASDRQLLDPRSPFFVGYGLRHGGRVRRFQGGGMPHLIGTSRQPTTGGTVGLGSLAVTTPRGVIGAALHGDPLTSIDSTIGAATDGRLEALRKSLVARARQGGPAKVVKHLQGAVDLIDFEIGRRIGIITHAIERRTGRVERGQGQLDRRLRRRGIDPASSTGIAAEMRFAGNVAVPAARKSVTDAEQALRRAKRTGSKEQIRAAVDQLNQARDDLGEQVTSNVERWRDLLRTGAQETVDRAQHATTMQDLGLQRLELEQRIKGTEDTGAGGQERADYIKQNIVPALNREIEALQTQQKAAVAAGDPTLADQIGEAIASRQNDTLQSIADAADATKQNTADTADAAQATTDAIKRTFPDRGGSVAFEDRGQVFTDLTVGT